MTIKLIRLKKQGKAVRGQITLPFDGQNPLVYPTLENDDFLIAPGTYPLRLTWSPRFKKLTPEICDVPKRAGLRFHLGTKPEHSKGCVLVQPEALTNLKTFINRIEKSYEDEKELLIEISDGCSDA